MHDALLARLGQRRRHLPHDQQRQPELRRAIPRNPLPQVHPLHVFLGDVIEPVGLPHVVNLHDIGVHQRRSGLGLPLEPLHIRGILRQPRLEHLDRHLPLERALLGQVHLGHGPVPQAPQQAEVAELPAREVRFQRFVHRRGTLIHRNQPCMGAPLLKYRPPQLPWQPPPLRNRALRNGDATLPATLIARVARPSAFGQSHGPPGPTACSLPPAQPPLRLRAGFLPNTLWRCRGPRGRPRKRPAAKAAPAGE